MESVTLKDSNHMNKVPDNFVVKIRTGNAIETEKQRLSVKASVPNKVRDLVKENDPILRAVMPNFDFNQWNGGALASQIENDLLLGITKYQGLGLAAPQIGLMHRAFVVGQDNRYEVMFNPIILSHGVEKKKETEGCLSFPGLFVDVERPNTIQVTWYNSKNQQFTHTFTGLTARIIQHELDHLNGKLMIDYISKFEWRRAKEKADKAKKRQARRGTGR